MTKMIRAFDKTVAMPDEVTDISALDNPVSWVVACIDDDIDWAYQTNLIVRHELTEVVPESVWRVVYYINVGGPVILQTDTYSLIRD